MINWINNIIDNFYFKRSLKRDNIGLSKKDIEWLKTHSVHQIRIMETVKGYILNTTFHSLTVRDHQRRKDYFDCLTTIQKLCSDTQTKQPLDWLTMKPKIKKKK